MLNDLVIFLLGLAAATFGWFIRRWWTGASADEKLARASNVLSLHMKLKAKGMSDGESIAFLNDLGVEGDAMTVVLKEVVNPDSDFSPLDTTAALGAQLDARARTLDSEIEELMLKLGILAGDDPNYAEALEGAHAAWKVYQQAEGHAAFEEMAGGTGRHINGLSTVIEVAELRIAYLKDRIAYRESL
jgi:hypothetical protein